MTRMFLILFLVCGLCAMSGVTIGQQVYKWVDEKGTVHFTQDPSTIPEKHRGQGQSLSFQEEMQSKEQAEVPVDYDFNLMQNIRTGDKWIEGYLINNTKRMIGTVFMGVNCYDKSGSMVGSKTVMINNLESGIKCKFKEHVDNRTESLKVIKLNHYY